MNVMKRKRIVKVIPGMIILVLASLLVAPIRAEEEYNLKASLQSPVPTSYAHFGWTVAVSGDKLVVSERTGRAYLFDINGSLIATMKPSNETTQRFGQTLGISGDVVVVEDHDAYVEGLSQAGKVYIYDTDGILQFTLLPFEKKIDGEFGLGVDVIGDMLVISYNGDVEDVKKAGICYIFDTDGNLKSTFHSPEPGADHFFGTILAVSADFIVVSPRTELSNIGVFVFDSEGNYLTTIGPLEPERLTAFGQALDISSDVIIIGSSEAEVDGKPKAGRAYVFDTDGNLLVTLESPTPDENGFFGCAVAISGDTIVVGESWADAEELNEGKAYVFDLDGNLQATLQSPTPRVGASFGDTVDVSGDIVVVGQPNTEVDGNYRAGTLYIFGPGPRVEPEAESEPVSTQEETETEEEGKPSFAIPGFPYTSITVGLVIGAVILWLAQRNR